MRFQKKVVLITGVNSGIGKSVALLFAKEGANIAGIDKNIDDTKIIVETCNKNNMKCQIYQLDLTDDDKLKNALDDIVQKFDQLDVLVNNAGIYTASSLLQKGLMNNFDRMLKNNLRTTVFLTHLAAPQLIKSKGNVVNISSASALRTGMADLSYSVSKSGVLYFTQCAALELAGSGVRVNSVSPGTVNTNISSNLGATASEIKSMIDCTIQKTPLKRQIEPEEIAEVVANLASNQSKNITGINVIVDGGLVLV